MAVHSFNVNEEPELKQEYIEKIERICKGKFRKVNNFSEEFELNDFQYTEKIGPFEVLEKP
ncbi:hypothetical protein [Methanococcus maripaludis]|uniref:Uncharacterized protein n=1 Tax=Methanococcus maripaludis TaxID=39152 RepID=A0A7J9S136_METMI|nr:hypothetical protein [Methanococcus maripaludis]MBB6068191.1 hypothetical protein [Methanococcus maripaludis]